MATREVVPRFAWGPGDVTIDPPDEEVVAAATPRWAALAAAAATPSGAMVALVPTDPDSLTLDTDGAEAAKELHLTLAYLGDAADWSPAQRDTLVDRLNLFAGGAPVVGRVFGAAHWNTDTDQPAWVLNVGGDQLAIVHLLVWDLFGAGGSDGDLPELPAQHAPWVPHVCLAYSPDPGLVEPMEARVGRDLEFTALRVAFGDEVTDLPLDGAPTNLPVDLAATLQQHGRRAFLAEALHLPGKHNQATHGHGHGHASGGGDAGDRPGIAHVFEGDDPTAAAADVFDFTHKGIRAEVTSALLDESDDRVDIDLKVSDGTGQVGHIKRSLTGNGDGTFTAHHDEMVLAPHVQGQGFASHFNRHAEDWYQANGVTEVRLEADIDVGGYAWAKAGYDFQAPVDSAKVARRLQQRRLLGRRQYTPDQQQALDNMVGRLTRTSRFGTADYPTPFEVAMVGRTEGASSWPGKDALLGSSWMGVKRLGPAPVAAAATDDGDRQERLDRIAAAFQAWEDDHLDRAPFDDAKGGEGSDYNLHHLTVDATPEQEDDLQARLGDDSTVASGEALHLPGKHDQRTHGHGHSKGGKGKGGTRGSGTADDPVVTSDAWAAADALGEGKHVQLESPDEVGTLLDRLHEIGLEAQADGSKAKLYDLCKVSVARTNLFCRESKGVARVNMPQFRGRPHPGSPADSLPKLQDGKVDLSRPFIDHLQAGGIGVSGDRVDASHLKATQRELDGVKVAGMMTAMESGKLRVRDAFFVSKDNYVVDGHHLWAATVGREFKEGRGLPLDVQRIDAPILDVLDQANTFTAAQGLPRAGMRLLRLLTEGRILMDVDAATARRIVVAVATGQPKPDDLPEGEAWFWDQAVDAFTDPPDPVDLFLPFDPGPDGLERLHLAGKHNQKLHGRKGGVGGRAGMGDIPIDDTRVKEFQGGSAMGHLVAQPGGGYAFSPERQQLHDQIIADALAGKAPPEGQPVYHMLGGGPAAGKSTFVDGPGGARAGLKDPNMVTVNADDMKAKLPEYGQRIAAKDPSASSFVHEESSYLAARLQTAAFENRLNTTLDGTGDNNPNKLRGKITQARSAGYRVEGHYVTVPTDLAVQRAQTRAAQTGRHVPEPVIRGTHAGVSTALPQVAGDFDSVNLYDTRGSTLEHVMEATNGTMTIHDPGLWDEFVAKGGG